MNEFEKAILKIIAERPGVKAKDIAQILGCDRKDVNSALYGALSSRCYQDSSYRWYLNAQRNNSVNIAPVAPPDKRLADICKYYLNCLSLEESNGISAFLTSNFTLDYAELAGMAVDSSDANIARLIRKVSAERNLAAHVGYPVLIEKIHSTRTNQDYLKVAPVFLFPIEISGGAVSVASIPHVNMEVIKQYSSRDINSQVYDLVDLESELGLNDLEADIDLDEMVARLQAIREWQWRDILDPAKISMDPPIGTITEEGIYNKAIFIVSERSPYTIGLESELSQLTRLDEASYRGTALYDWVHRNTTTFDELATNDTPLLEVLPMNSEQEQAIRHATSNKLTIVTGPPGTGKSQVVSNLLVNAAWNGKSVLFTSKNNKAVDVVETRVNSLGRRPIMLRIGGNQYAYHLAELIADLLAYSADQNDRQEYQRYQSLYQDKITAYQALKKKKESAVILRNHADHMEQKACELRDKWGKWFSSGSVLDEDACEQEFNHYCSAYNAWQRSKNSFFGRLLWFAIGKNKTTELQKNLDRLNACFQKYEQAVVATEAGLLDSKYHKRICDIGQQLIYALQTINEYHDALADLLAAPQFEDIDRELIKIKSDLADIAEKLWNKWLVTRPLQMDATCRSEMNEYVSAMRLIGDVDLSDYPDIRKKFNHLQQKMTAFLPCWAVTSLSAKGRVPFQPGIFDLVVIDEASQCDIASVLPMLYRAKRAIIIGDPKQLSHISTISKAQDLSLLQKYNVDMGWAYSANSLYAIASSLSDPNHIIQLRDHHRSFGDIIEFSNAEFYDGKLRVATNYDRLRCPENVSAGIRWVDVVGKTVRPPSGGAYNDSEVAAIIDELKHLVVENGYKGTVGVVTPFRVQAEKIGRAIEKIPELKSALTNNDFLVDTVHKFQGDERDLMFFSPVISQGTSQGALGFLKNTGNLFNVAITRARAVLVVVGDHDYCAKCGVPYMEHFVDHVNRIKSQQEQEIITTVQYPADRLYPKVANPEQVSDWERLFYTALFDHGIQTVPQYPVDKYKLDLAIVDGERMLDIEIDGEMYHKDWNGELSYRDQLRNQRLFELGWDVKRFWVYQIRDDLQSCIDQIAHWCNSK
ncbi:MAG: AAA domain-containing protein [Oscillibacter sp.]|nr:AAA domain-containing protein [Oscillibacter sp.]